MYAGLCMTQYRFQIPQTFPLVGFDLQIGAQGLRDMREPVVGGWKVTRASEMTTGQRGTYTGPY